MKYANARLVKPYSYESITRHCSEQIKLFMADARRHSEPEAQHWRERAYGVYMGWRSIVLEHADPEAFRIDDQCLEDLLRTRG